MKYALKKGVKPISCPARSSSPLDALLAGWCTAYSDHPLAQLVTSSGMPLLTIPHPPQLDAEDTQGSAVRSVLGVVMHEGPRFQSGVAFRRRAGGRRAWQFEQAGGVDVVKEVWRVEEGNHVPGKALHALGRPLSARTYGGGWDYHVAESLISIGLDYKNPYIGCIASFRCVPFPRPYTAPFAHSPAHADLWAVRNVRPALNRRWGGLLHAGLNGAVDVDRSCEERDACPSFSPPSQPSLKYPTRKGTRCIWG
ncbi:hypothetical protein K438DRAFT_1982897 [Mycena galopus ATCC 62051]|nr:hypothetical protein K438DRAFT_1982897 [Mycena galopus ATCC 62051]